MICLVLNILFLLDQIDSYSKIYIFSNSQNICSVLKKADQEIGFNQNNFFDLYSQHRFWI